MSSKRSLIALAAGAMLLGGCATYPYDTYGYNDGYYYDRPAYRYYNNAPPYYPPYYVAPPVVTFGLAYNSRGHWHR